MLNGSELSWTEQMMLSLICPTLVGKAHTVNTYGSTGVRVGNAEMPQTPNKSDYTSQPGKVSQLKTGRKDTCFCSGLRLMAGGSSRNVVPWLSS